MVKNNKKRLNREVVRKIRESKDLKNKLCFELKFSMSTLFRWLEEDNTNLLREDFLKILSEELNINIENLTEDGESKVARGIGRPKRGTIRDKR